MEGDEAIDGGEVTDAEAVSEGTADGSGEPPLVNAILHLILSSGSVGNG